MVCKCVDCGRVVDEGYAMSPINDGVVGLVLVCLRVVLLVIMIVM